MNTSYPKAPGSNVMPVADLATVDGSTDVQQTPEYQSAVNLFLDNGCLLLKNVFDPEYIGMLGREFSERYKDYFYDRTYRDAFTIGDKRTMVSLSLEGPFAEASFFAQPKVIPILEFLLTKRLIVAAMGAALSLPGAAEQHRHRDYTNIYDPGFYYPAMEFFVANAFPYAITLGVPLVPINRKTGCTRFWPGSHLSLISPDAPELGPGVEFEVDLGSAYLFDFRVVHCGAANTSDIVRPLLYVTYTRPWFRDPVNYAKQEPVYLTEQQLAEMPAEHQRLFSWAVVDHHAARLGGGGPVEGLCLCGSGLLYKWCHGRQEPSEP